VSRVIDGYRWLPLTRDLSSFFIAAFGGSAFQLLSRSALW